MPGTLEGGVPVDGPLPRLLIPGSVEGEPVRGWVGRPCVTLGEEPRGVGVPTLGVAGPVPVLGTVGVA